MKRNQIHQRTDTIMHIKSPDVQLKGVMVF
nr:unnamed protein product [Callosobruchus analis]CAI5851476.1 unnamed protein product [Callosobruchus analis]